MAQGFDHLGRIARPEEPWTNEPTDAQICRSRRLWSRKHRNASRRKRANEAKDAQDWSTMPNLPTGPDVQPTMDGAQTRGRSRKTRERSQRCARLVDYTEFADLAGRPIDREWRASDTRCASTFPTTPAHEVGMQRLRERSQRRPRGADLNVARIDKVGAYSLFGNIHQEPIWVEARTHSHRPRGSPWSIRCGAAWGSASRSADAFDMVVSSGITHHV